MKKQQLSNELTNRIRLDRLDNTVPRVAFDDAAAIRRLPVTDPAKRNDIVRTPFMRDTDKIMYCPYYNRYADKTQVFSFFKNDDITRRGLHVQLVNRIGRTIGVPTVNLRVPANVLVPSHGVYATKAVLEDGRAYAAVTNVGVRPTVDDGRGVTVEAWLLDFDGDLYGQSVRVEFFTKLRDEIRFDSLDALKRQIALDADSTRKYFAEHFIISK